MTFEPATLRELTTGLPNPFNLIDGEAPVFQGALDLDLDLEPQPAIAGVTGDTDFTVDIVDIYEVLAGDETINWGLPNNNQAGKLLVAVENLTIDAVIDYLGDAADYLVELETESTLGDLLPGMSQSVGQFLGFGASFKAVVEELDKEPPQLARDAADAVGSDFVRQRRFTSGPIAWSFDTGVSRLLKLDTDLTVDPVTKQLPLTLNLQQVNPAMLATLGLSSAGIIVDTFRSSPLSVTVDGSIGLDLGIIVATRQRPPGSRSTPPRPRFRWRHHRPRSISSRCSARCPSRSTKAASFLIRTATAVRCGCCLRGRLVGERIAGHRRGYLSPPRKHEHCDRGRDGRGSAAGNADLGASHGRSYRRAVHRSREDLARDRQHHHESGEPLADAQLAVRQPLLGPGSRWLQSGIQRSVRKTRSTAGQDDLRQ